MRKAKKLLKSATDSNPQRLQSRVTFGKKDPDSVSGLTDMIEGLENGGHASKEIDLDDNISIANFIDEDKVPEWEYPFDDGYKCIVF